MKLDDDLRKLINELSEVINEAIETSSSLRSALRRLRRKGYNIFLILEATMGGKKVPLTPKGNGGKRNTNNNNKVNRYRLEMTKSDRDFLRALKISLDDPKEKGEK